MSTGLLLSGSSGSCHTAVVEEETGKAAPQDAPWEVEGADRCLLTTNRPGVLRLTPQRLITVKAVGPRRRLESAPDQGFYAAVPGQLMNDVGRSP